MTTVEATVYRGTKEGKVVEGEEIFTPGGEELLIKARSLPIRALTIRSHILAYAVPIYTTLNTVKYWAMKE